MIGVFKTPYLCDRRLYDKRGKWRNPNTEEMENIYYFIKEAPTLVADWNEGKEEIKQQYTIVVFGGKPIVAYDKIILEDGKTMEVQAPITYNYIETNILVKDMLKPRIGSIELTLE